MSNEFREWYIPSRSIPNRLHSVILHHGKYSCTCDHAIYHSDKENCWHIKQAKGEHYDAGFAEMESLDNLGREKEIG